MDGTIPGSSNEFVKQVSSRAYDMRRNLQQSFDSSSYDVLEANPWRERSKSVLRSDFILNTVKLKESLDVCFPMVESGEISPSRSGVGTKFQMLVEDVQEGVLVFEDQNEAARYCDLLQGGGQNCEGVAEIEASSVFDLCSKNRALAVLFYRGRTPPRPESLKLNLWARKRSLEDHEDFI
ncbi:hypothetical protein Fot_15952 [Forsythia ovata]|uniref:Uncharacterized protein n=1 Tax=Forsythia ovata TaxID=205694 RepID=A0ABD1WAL9_9LAMI